MKNMPHNVRRFVWLWLVAVALYLSPLVYYFPSGARLDAAYLIGVLFVFVVDGVCWVPVWLAAFQQKNWARWVSLLVFGISQVQWRGVTLSYLETYPFVAVTWISGLLVEALAYVFIFTGDANPWFRPEPIEQVFD